MGLFDGGYAYAPLWVLAAGFFAGLVLAHEVGRFLRSRRPVRNGAGDDDAFSMKTALSLLVLLIGFTFSIALSRYEERRQLVVAEANAIGTVWLELQLLDGNEHARMKALLRRYVDVRVAFGRAGSSGEEVELNRQSVALQMELWDAIMAAIAPFRDTSRAQILVDAVNELNDTANRRYASRHAHIPSRIVRMLASFALLSAGMIGYERSAHRKGSLLLFVLLMLAAALIMDLDRPSTGMISVPQEPMLDLRDSIMPVPEAHDVGASGKRP